MCRLMATRSVESIVKGCSGPRCWALNCAGALRVLRSPRADAEGEESQGNLVADRGLDQGLIGESALDRPAGPGEDLVGGDGPALCVARVRRDQHLFDEEIDDGLGLGGVAVGPRACDPLGLDHPVGLLVRQRFGVGQPLESEGRHRRARGRRRLSRSPTTSSRAATAGLRRHHRQATPARLVRRARMGSPRRTRCRSSASASADCISRRRLFLKALQADRIQVERHPALQPAGRDRVLEPHLFERVDGGRARNGGRPVSSS